MDDPQPAVATLSALRGGGTAPYADLHAQHERRVHSSTHEQLKQLAAELGASEGREAGFRHPAVLVTAQRILDADPSVIHVVPLTTTLRGFHSEVVILPDAGNGLDTPSAAQCQHVRTVSPGRLSGVRGNVGTMALAQIRAAIAVVLDLP